MDNNYNTPYELIENNINEGVKKAKMSLLKTMLFGILAGMFVAIGAQGSGFAIHNIHDAGIAKTIAGTIFPVGLMMIVMVGGQLFTGNCMLSMGAFEKKITWMQVVRNLTIIFFSNMIGAIFIAVMVYFSGQFDVSSGGVGAYTIKVAIAKVNIPGTQAFVSGILCNIIVCVSILLAGAAKDIAGKCIAIFFTIWVFVVSGFEHCVANMYYIPAGILASKNPQYVEKAGELYGITQDKLDTLTVKNMAFHNLFPVTLGNIIGGMFIIGGIMYLVYRSKALNGDH